jgi:hypothetical protein
MPSSNLSWRTRWTANKDLLANTHTHINQQLATSAFDDKLNRARSASLTTGTQDAAKLFDDTVPWFYFVEYLERTELKHVSFIDSVTSSNIRDASKQR